MTHIVLVHGAYHGAWCWTKLIPILEHRGHRVTALDMPGCGADRTPLRNVTFASYGDRIVETLRTSEAAVTLVGHSLGTMAVALAAEREPSRIGKLVFLGGVIPRDGMSLYTLLQMIDAPDAPIRAAPPPGDAWSGLSQDPPLDQVARVYYNDCSEADIGYAVAHLRPQANAPRVTPVALTEARFGAVPKVFIGCSLDNANTVARQEGTLALDPCARVMSLPTSHSPFFSAPEALADMLGAL